jgi:hypothetical protein
MASSYLQRASSAPLLGQHKTRDEVEGITVELREREQKKEILHEDLHEVEVGLG